MQTILGSGGAIGRELAISLAEYTEDIRLVSRNPEKINPSDELLPADLRVEAEVKKAVEGSSVVYVTVGFPYKTNVWRQEWPKLVSRVIDACMENHSKLVFFDNIYMYDPDYLDGMTEETPVRPVSKKGAVRAEIAGRIMEEVQKGELTALIARCADYYGPGIQQTSILTETVVKPLSEGKKANWMGSVDVCHSFTYTPDAGKATALLGNTEDAYNQVWHLPTASDRMTGKEWIEAVAESMGVAPEYRRVPPLMVKGMGLIIPFMRELGEMLYQYDRNYHFDSSKFEKRFGFEPTPYRTGIRETVKAGLPTGI